MRRQGNHLGDAPPPDPRGSPAEAAFMESLQQAYSQLPKKTGHDSFLGLLKGRSDHIPRDGALRPGDNMVVFLGKLSKSENPSTNRKSRALRACLYKGRSDPRLQTECGMIPPQQEPAPRHDVSNAIKPWCLDADLLALNKDIFADGAPQGHVQAMLSSKEPVYSLKIIVEYILTSHHMSCTVEKAVKEHRALTPSEIIVLGIQEAWCISLLIDPQHHRRAAVPHTVELVESCRYGFVTPVIHACHRYGNEDCLLRVTQSTFESYITIILTRIADDIRNTPPPPQ